MNYSFQLVVATLEAENLKLVLMENVNANSILKEILVTNVQLAIWDVIAIIASGDTIKMEMFVKVSFIKSIYNGVYS